MHQSYFGQILGLARFDLLLHDWISDRNYETQAVIHHLFMRQIKTNKFAINAHHQSKRVFDHFELVEQFEDTEVMHVCKEKNFLQYNATNMSPVQNQVIATKNKKKGMNHSK